MLQQKLKLLWHLMKGLEMNDKPIRRTQAIAPFGPGAIVDFPGPLSLMHAGLDAYPFDPNNKEHEEFKIDDEVRLRKRVRADYFVEPLDYRKPKPGIEYRNPNLKLPFVKFPLWHYCPRCGRMYKSEYHRSDFPTCEGPIGSGVEVNKSHRKRRCYQVRFLTVCTEGHISDFPWERWLFDGSKSPRDPRQAEWLSNFDAGDSNYWLRYRASGSAAASGIEIRAEKLANGKVELIKKKTLGQVFSAPEASAAGDSEEQIKLSPLGRLPEPITCDGTNPTLGIGSAIKPAQGCGSQLYVSLKNATNLYFPSVYASIFVPVLDESDVSRIEVREILENYSVIKQLKASAFNNEVDGRVTMRGAKNVIKDHFPHYLTEEIVAELVVAANHPKMLRQYLEMEADIQEKIARIEELGDTPDISDYSRWLDELSWELNPELLLNAEDERDESPEDLPTDEEYQEELFRHDEYSVFIKETFVGMPKTHLHVEPQEMDSYPEWMRSCFKRISLLPKLRETRVFTGFNRIFSNHLELEQRKSLFRESHRIKWLPGTVVRGEGVFIDFATEAIDRWYEKYQQILAEKEGYLFNAKVKLKRQDPNLLTRISAEMVLLHTFAHILINQLIYDSGYGSASLRERIYCSNRTPNRMSGVLIYTAAGDTEGSMGGLVRLGESDMLPQILEDALIRASWCSADPICGESKGQGLFGGNLAACHACTLLPETSCEHMNLFLDRSMLVGMPETPEIGFFSHVLGGELNT
jgi:hypothetical protein